MQQNQPQQEFSQDHIVRRLISKFRKPSDAGTMGLQPGSGSGNTLQVPQAQPGGAGLPTISGALAASSSADSGHSTATSAGGAGTSGGAGGEGGARAAGSSIARSLAGKQSRWSQLVASAAAGAAGAGKGSTGQAGAGSKQLLDVARRPAAGADGQPQISGDSSSNRSSADGCRDDEVDENYFRPGGKGHQALLDNMDKR